MRNLEAFLLGAALGAVLMGFARKDDFVRLSRDMREAEDSIAVLQPTVERLSAEADSLRPLAHRSDTVRVYIERAVAADVEAARERYTRSADSLRATLDSTQSVLLANIETSHKAEVRAIQRGSDSNLAWGTSWRDYAMSLDSLAKAQAAQLALQSIVNDGLRQAVIRERQQVWLSRSAALLGVVTVLVLK